MRIVQLEKFLMEEAVKRPIIRDHSQVVCEESEETVLDGDTPQRVVSADGYDLIYRIPGAFEGKALVSVYLLFPRPSLTAVLRRTYRRSAINGVTWRKSSRR